MKKLKWLLIVLILLNIAVFLYLFTPDPAPKIGQQPAVEVSEEINGDWLSFDEPISNETAAIMSDVVIEASQVQAASDTNLTQQSNQIASETEEPQLLCIDTVTLKEEDYTTLKNKLNRVGGFQANKQETKTQAEVKVEDSILYLVQVPTTSNVETQIKLLKDQGFNANQSGKQISLGQFKNASQALDTKQKAFNAGFTQVNISEQVQPGQRKTEEKIVISYQLKFSPMPQDEAKQIQSILKNKAKLSTKACKK